MKTKTSLSTKIVVYFGLLILITISNFGILINTESKIEEQHNWVLHTYEVIKESERFLGYLRDAETGQRGFLLTLNDSYLEPFNDGILHANLQFERLEYLTQDNMSQQTLLISIQTLMSGKISELEKTIQLAKENKLSEAMFIVNDDHGKILMDNIRKHIGDFVTKEEILLKHRTELYLKNKNNLRTWFFLEVVILISLIALSYFLIQKGIVRPLTHIKNYITNEGHHISGAGIKLNTMNDEIGSLIEAFNRLHRDLASKDNEKNVLIADLQIALNEVKTLKDIIPICSYCHKIRDDDGAWDGILQYVSKHSSAQFSHGICPECLVKARSDAGLTPVSE